MNSIPLDLSRAQLKPAGSTLTQLPSNLTCGSGLNAMVMETPAPQSELHFVTSKSGKSRRAVGKTPYYESILQYVEKRADYDPINGGFIVHTRVTNGATPPGIRWGSLNTIGRWHVNINKSQWWISHLVWLWHYGALPENKMEIDHINGSPKDDRIENLREVSSTLNKRNTRKKSTNTSGITGVSYYKPTGKWMASIRINGKTKYLGYFWEKEDAAAAYRKFIDDNPELGFTERHGK